MTTHDDTQAQAGEDAPRPVPMSGQGASYGSSYVENEPGQIEANREHALQGQEEPDEQPSGATAE